MIQKQSVLYVVDNTGVRLGLCVSTPLGFLARLGDVVLLSARGCSADSKFKNGQLVKGLIVRLKKNQQRSDGCFFSFDSNGAVLLNAQGLPISKRIFGPVSYSLRSKNFFKIIFLARAVI